MGVRRLFSRGEQNFPGGENILFALKTPKYILFFSKKSQKTYYFVQPRGGGARAPGALALPFGRP